MRVKQFNLATIVRRGIVMHDLVVAGIPKGKRSLSVFSNRGILAKEVNNTSINHGGLCIPKNKQTINISMRFHKQSCHIV